VNVPPAATTPDVATSRPPEPAPIATPPVVLPESPVMPHTPRATVPPANADPGRSELSAPVVAPPAVMPDTPSATELSADADSRRSEPSAPVVAPPAVVRDALRATTLAPATAESGRAEPSPRLAPPALPSTKERLKEWAGYIPEVWLARTIYRWAKKQPPPDGTRPEEPPPPQAR
jgi:hypothetical protein